MTKFDDVKKKIKNLVKEDNCDKLKEGVKKLHTFIETYPIKKVIRTPLGYIDFYEIVGYDSEGNETLGPRIGKISIHEYNKNKKIIESLRKEADSEELKKYIKENKNKKEESKE